MTARAIAVGAGLTLAALLVFAYVFISFGLVSANADATPPALEKWAARASLRATLAREAKGQSPLAPTEADLMAGVRLYAVNCAACHGAADGRPSKIARGLYQKAPQFAEDGVTDDPESKIAWFVRHGVRLTGMPAFGPTFTETELWQVVAFLKRMDKLPTGPAEAWRTIPSAAK